MEVSLIFKIAAVGILVSVLCQILKHSGRDEQAFLVSLAGLLKGLHTFIKCNPTLLGYEFARKTMDEMGYDYVAFGDFHFLDDLQYKDAIPMLQRLKKLAGEKNLEFGVKITNTFPVDVKQNELPSEEMYMSGKSLYPLSISLAAKLAKEFDGQLRISYSGGADYHNIKSIVDAGIWPVTVATLPS